MNNNKLNNNFYKTMLSIAVPIALQNLISSFLNMIDTVMIGRLGGDNIAAVGLANQYFFLMILLIFGINSGAAIFIAQFWGKKDIKNIHRVMGIALITGSLLSLVFTIGGLIVPHWILRIFIEDTEVIYLGSKYLRIVAISYIPTAISFTYAVSCRSIGQPKLPMKVSVISLICNTFLNYILIFGKLGFAPMGITGAAIATVISRIVELILLTGVIYRSDEVLACGLKDLFDLNKEFVKRIFKTILPVILNEGFWALGMTLYAIAYGKIGAEAFAAVQIAQTVERLFMVFAQGLASACAVMIGNSLGSDDRHEADSYAKKFSVIGNLMGVFLGLILFFGIPLIISPFNVSPQVSQDTTMILRVLSGFMFLKFYNTILIIGVFRGGGDTKYSLLLEIFSIYGIGVPLAFWGAIFWEIPVYIVVLLVSFEEFIKAIFGTFRMFSKKWAKNIVNDM